ncbi:Ger(x)C family spore germination protein [Alicyclobacillus cycloheptanicus]|uniref:Ger(X)C family germination protein n=1 Tax=Alicyclobacillus cycloheptanicus TaxID=1457 RepID=A0ABT9XLQ3_9BACL|nr:Ger(x)C family spore germination protein [Alicyclobacillus cycloheptanicus]MDQ0191244.1 Ger(x)C family germination protein [Alicyclobacillus cycloheptanicus]WDM01522.1 Ger(x)C family spore germination protein [Alicyclobacillus cycloheptanicus]
MRLWGRRRQVVGIAAMCALSFLTTGCFDRMELEQQAFVVALGVDKAPGNMVDCSFLISLPVNPNGGGGGDAGNQPTASKGPITFRAHSITEAMQLANSSVERTLTLSHLSLILFSSSMAKHGLDPEIRPLVRYREFRRTTFVAVSEGNARDILAANAPVLEKSTSRWADDIADVGRRSNLIPVTQLHDFLRRLEDAHEDPIVPLCAINQTAASSSGSSLPSGGLSYTAGSISRAGGNPVEWSGAAVFRKDKQVDELNGRQVMDLRMLQGRLSRAKYTFPDPYNKNETVGLTIRRERAPEVNVQLTRPMQISVVIPLEGDLISTQVTTNYDLPAARTKLQRTVDQALSKELSTLVTHLSHDDGVDVVPISRYVRGRFATYSAFAQYPWEQQLSSANINVQVQLQVRRFGIQSKPVQST